MYRELRETSGCKGCRTAISSTWAAVHHSSYAEFSPVRISSLVYLKYLCIELVKQWINTFILYPRLHSFVEGIVSFRFLLSLFSFYYLLLHTIVFYSFVARMWGKTESIVWTRYIQTVQKELYGWLFNVGKSLYPHPHISNRTHIHPHIYKTLYFVLNAWFIWHMFLSIVYPLYCCNTFFSFFQG